MPHSRTPIPVADRSRWFKSHYCEAALEVVEFFGGDRISLTNRRVGDIGCGDGALDLGIAHLATPAELIGFDITPTDVDLLRDVALAEGVSKPIPETLEFRVLSDGQLPCEDGYFDYLISWSVFEHVEDPVLLAREMRRVIADHGVLMVQVWPFYHSEHGSHLWQFFPEGFTQLRMSEAAMAEHVRANLGEDPAWGEYLLDLLPGLNRISVDDLQRALLAAGFVIGKVELLTHGFHVPRELAHLPLSQLGIAGVKLLAGVA